MDTHVLLKFGLIPGFGALLIWLTAMSILRSLNFNPDGMRKDDKRNLSPELLSKQIEYHNLATYKALEFYIKVLLAILGGLAYIILNKDKIGENFKILVDAAR